MTMRKRRIRADYPPLKPDLDLPAAEYAKALENYERKRAAWERRRRPARMADCHPERKHRAHGLCRPCYDRAYYEANPERIRERKRAHREANPALYREHFRAYREANRERERERQRAYREANVDRLRERRAYRAAKKAAAT